MLKTAIFASVLLLGACQSTSRVPGPETEFKGADVFDGNSFQARSVCVASNRIVECTGRAEEIIDVSGRYIIPPLADAHTHHFDGAGTFEWHRSMYLSSGVFYALSLTTPTRSTIAIRDRFSGPGNVDVASSLGGITGPQSHPAEIYEALALGIRSFEEQVARANEIRAGRAYADDAYFVVETREDVAEKFALLMEAEPDVVKVFLRQSDRYDEGFGKWGPGGGIEPGLLPLIANLAAAHEKPLAVATSNVADYRAAVAVGASFVTHLPCYQDSSADPDSPYFDIDTADDCLISEDDALTASVHGVTHLLITSEWETPRPADYEDWERRNIETLLAADTDFAIGSNSYGKTVVPGLLVAAERGLFSPSELLRLATRETATAIFPDRRVGCLENGCEASFLVLDADPLDDFSAITKISLAVKDGETLSGN